MTRYVVGSDNKLQLNRTETRQLIIINTSFNENHKTLKWNNTLETKQQQ